MERLLNIYHYSLYYIHYSIYRQSPFYLVFKIPIIKKRIKKSFIENFRNNLESGLGNKESGFSVMVSGGVVIGTLCFLLTGSFEFIKKLLFGKDFVLNYYHFGVIFLLVYGVCYLYVFRKDKYLAYFDEFEGWSKKQRRLNLTLSFLFGISTFGLAILVLIV